MNVLIVCETSFGNTRQVAEAIADGLRASGHATILYATDEAPTELPRDIDLLLLGSPTHNMSMSTTMTRARAAAEGAPERPRIGIRDWIDRVDPRRGLVVRTFDTRTTGRFQPSAAREAARALKANGFHAAKTGESFQVDGLSGDLAAGEVDRARQWGATLPTLLRNQTTVA